MSNRGGFLEGLIVGTLLGGLSVLVASPSARQKIQSRIQQFCDDNDEVFESTKESTEDLIEKTKQSIESGFDRLGDIIKENQAVKGATTSSTPDNQ
jgi:gas vesicle protein